MTDSTLILPPPPNGSGKDLGYRLTVLVPKRRFLSYLRERWWVVLICMVLTLGSMLAYETVRSDTYESVAQLLIGDVQVNMANLFTEDPLNYFGTQIELLKSSRLQGAAARKAGVPPSTDEKDRIRLQVARPLGTAILQLQATGANPGLTKGFLDALIEEYLAFKKETRNSTTEDLVISLNDQLAKRETTLKSEQEKWVEFQRTNNFAVIEEEGKAAGLYLAELNLQLAKLRLERDLLRQGIVKVQTDALPGAGMAAATNGLAAREPARTRSDSLLSSARLEYALRRQELDQLVAERGEIAGRRLGQEVTRLSNTVALLEAQSTEQSKSDLAELERRIAVTEAAVPSWEKKVLQINERLSTGQRLRNNIQREQGYNDHLLSMFQSVDLSRTVQQERLSILQPPSQSMPTPRMIPLRVALAGIAGLALGLGLVFAWHMLDDKFTCVRDLKDQFGEEVLGLVPRIEVKKSKPREAVLLDADGRRAYVESFRHLRSAVLLSSTQSGGSQVMLFTGVTAGEGKTTIAVNLAHTLARSGLKVALVDADVSMGGVRRLLGKEDHPGILDCLRGEVALEDAVQATDVPGLVFLSSGTRVSGDEGLFLRPTLLQLIGRLRETHDYVILDGSPILASDDAALLVPQADAVMVVVRPFFTSARQLHLAMGMLYQRRAKRINLVFNQAGPNDMGRGYGMNGSAVPVMPPRLASVGSGGANGRQ